MSHELDLIFTLTGAFTAAVVLGLLTHRLRLSPIVGYLLAGVAIGPFTPGFVAHSVLAAQVAELGVILLMFGVGLHFHVKDLLAVRRVAVPGAIVQVAVATLLGTLVARAVGWTLGAGIVFGLSISVASTVVVLRVLTDHEKLHTAAGHVAMGWLLVQDVLTVLVLVLLPILAVEPGGDGGGSVWASMGIAVVKIAALVAFTVLVGQRLIPKILSSVARTRSRELFTLTVLALALGIAVGSAKLFGASMALGAFLAGMVVGQSNFSARAASEALPMRDAFAVVFFVSMGMLFDPARLVPNIESTALALAVILIGNPIVSLVVALALKAAPRTAVTVSVALGQIGEFSFMLAALGRQLGILPDAATQCLVAASIISITLNPLAFRLVEPLSRWLSSRMSQRGSPSERRDPPPDEPASRTVIVGYGPVGRTLSRLVRENGLEPTIIELNHETVDELVESGVSAVYGDASQRDILEHAGVRQAGSLVFAASGSPEEVIRVAKDLNPGILVLSRATYQREIGSLEKLGADVVVAAEVEVALAMTERLLVQLGATPEQLDLERDRVRQELTGGSEGKAA